MNVLSKEVDAVYVDSRGNYNYKCPGCGQHVPFVSKRLSDICGIRVTHQACQTEFTVSKTPNVKS